MKHPQDFPPSRHHKRTCDAQLMKVCPGLRHPNCMARSRPQHPGSTFSLTLRPAFYIRCPKKRVLFIGMYGNRTRGLSSPRWPRGMWGHPIWFSCSSSLRSPRPRSAKGRSPLRSSHPGRGDHCEADPDPSSEVDEKEFLVSQPREERLISKEGGKNP